MNGYIQRYIKQATTFFPVVGKPERQYLEQLTRSIQNHFFWSAPESLEEVTEVFGLPQTAVRNYLVHADTKDIVRRVRVRRLIRICAMTVLGLCLMVALCQAVHFALDLKILYEVEGYDPPAYTAEEMPVE